MLNKQRIEEALKAVKDVQGDGNVVTAGRVERINIDGTSITLTLSLPTHDAEVRRRVEDECRAAIKTVEGAGTVMIMTKGTADPAEQASAQQSQNPFDEQAPIEGVKSIIAVSSAKGGVGKSTVCVNLALAMQQKGARVGLLDADVYGPSLHVLLGVKDRPLPGRKKEISPVQKDGLKLMSLGFLTDKGTPVIWRGPIVMGVVKKFLQDVEWGDLDYLMIDMPPGTGDAQLTLVQTVPLTGAIIVTTPSELALVDAEKGLQMYRTVGAPVFGIVENMSYFICPHCGEKTEIFSYGGGRDIAGRLETDFLGEIPIDPQIRAGGDRGEPVVKVDRSSPISNAFAEIAEAVMKKCS